MIQGTCSMCGQPGHRYGTTDPEHEYDAMGCVNMLRPALEAAAERLERAEVALREISEASIEVVAIQLRDHALAALTPENPEPPKEQES